MRLRTGWLIAWAVLTLLVVLSFRGVAWDAALSTFGQADFRWLLLAVAANFLILPLAALQWIRFLPRGASVGFRPMFWITAVTSTVSNGGPFLAGHAAGIHLLATRGGVGHASAVSVKAVEQLATGMAKLTILGVVFLLVPLPVSYRATAFTLGVVVPLLGLGLLFAAHRAHRLEAWAAERRGWLGSVLSFLVRVAAQLDAIRNPGTFWVGFILALLQKGAEALAIWAVVMALGVQIPGWGVLLVLSAVVLSTMASVTPANLGIYEGSVLLAYSLIGVEPEVALGLSVVQHVAYLIPMAGVGWVLLAFRGLRIGEVVGESKEDSEERGSAAEG